MEDPVKKPCTTQNTVWSTGSALVHPVQWYKVTELVQSRMCLKKLTLASWTGLIITIGKCVVKVSSEEKRGEGNMSSKL